MLQGQVRLLCNVEIILSIHQYILYNRTRFQVIPDLPVASSQSTALLSRPLDRMYLEFFENRTDDTGSSSCPPLNVFTHRLLTPSHTLGGGACNNKGGIHRLVPSALSEQGKRWGQKYDKNVIRQNQRVLYSDHPLLRRPH